MFNYEIWTIAVPQNRPDIQEKFFEFMNDKDFSHLMCGAIHLELKKEEDVKKVLESYVKTACKESGFSVDE
jgi:hypothetical protein